VLTTVSKILEKAVYTQLESYLVEHHLLYEHQSGFRSNHSTNTCLVNITDFIRTEISKGHYVGMVALDVQKAFDSVNHEILCSKLELMGIKSNWFQSYLSDRKQVVKIKEISSKTLTIQNGVPQGSLLGPLLYLCYCNDMQIAVNAKLVLYADDCMILVPGKCPNQIASQLSEELELSDTWLIENKLSLHPGKCESMLFCSKRKSKSLTNFSVRYKDHNITANRNVKYLGTTVDQTLSGHDNVSQITNKENGKLKFMYRNAIILDR